MMYGLKKTVCALLRMRKIHTMTKTMFPIAEPLKYVIISAKKYFC